MKFTKMHGLGNDYVFVNCFEERVENPSALARAVSDRHRGIGGDGLILIQPSDTADVRTEIYNTDGSRAQMCGNGIRCVAKYAVEHGLARYWSASAEGGMLSPGEAGGKHAVRCGALHGYPRLRRVKPRHPGHATLRIETDAGVKPAECHVVDGVVRSVRVDMGRPSLAASAIPSTIPADRIINHPLLVGGCEYVVTCVSMGNPHAVVFVDNLDAITLELVGPKFEHAPEFPERINVHFVRVDSPAHVTMKTWERGSGITRACGTGACAVCVAGALTQRTRRAVTATLPGGDLQLEWADDDHVYMTGPAVEVFSGNWPRQ